jgi:hypothetical protein
MEEAATAPFRVAGGEDTTGDEEGQRSWTVKGPQGEGTDAPGERVQVGGGEGGGAVEVKEVGAVGLGVFPVGEADEDVGLDVGRRVGDGAETGEADDAGLVAEGWGVGVGVEGGKRNEGLGAAGVAKEGGGAATAGADDEVVEAIAIEIEPGDAWTGLAEATWEERLAGEVVEGLVEMAVVEEGGEVLEVGGVGSEGGGGGEIRSW